MDWLDSIARDSWQSEDTVADKQAFLDLVIGFSVETLHRAGHDEASDRDLLPPGTRIHVGPKANVTLQRIISASRSIRREGFEPVAVIVPRSFDRHDGIADFLTRLREEADVHEVVILGTETHDATGTRRSALDALTTGLFERHGFTRIGVAVNPRPKLPNAAGQLGERVAQCNAWALRTDAEIYFLTAPGTDIDAVIAWERSARRSGNLLPVRTGLKGPSAWGILSGLERICGIRPSYRDADIDGVAALAGIALTAPHQALKSLARHKQAEPGCMLQAPHFITREPLGGTAMWLDALLREALTLRDQRGRFSVRLNAAG